MTTTRTRIRTPMVVRAVKIRADGTRVDLGVVSAVYENPWRQLWWILVGRQRAAARIRAENKRSS